MCEWEIIQVLPYSFVTKCRRPKVARGQITYKRAVIQRQPTSASVMNQSFST
jgi:hypothetical protein